jgi:hypothetical protein
VKLTNNFTYEEFFVSDKYPQIAAEIALNAPKSIKACLYLLCKYIMQPVRDELGIPIIVTSGVRNRKLLIKIYNDLALPPPEHSYHEDGIACDFTLQQKDRLKEAFDFIKLFLGDYYSELILYKDSNGWRNIHVALSAPREQLTLIKEV